ncbi:unnamed protein product [Orchesella dallaii]|uniref:WAP domain-containing protein n=1 Tax=Orchesella dallaii TaxID=48710 RepID=A0ABP1R7P0_9HEXA
MKLAVLSILIVAFMVYDCHAYRGGGGNWKGGRGSSSTSTTSSTTTSTTSTTTRGTTTPPKTCGASIYRTKRGTCPPPPNIQCFDCNDSCRSDADCPGQWNICCKHPCGNQCSPPLERSSK